MNVEADWMGVAWRSRDALGVVWLWWLDLLRSDSRRYVEISGLYKKTHSTQSTSGEYLHRPKHLNRNI